MKLTSAGAKDTTFGGGTGQICLGGSAYDTCQGKVVQCPDGSYVIGGQTGSTNGDVSGKHGSYDMWVIKLTSAGSKDTTFGGGTGQICLGGSGYENCFSIIQTFDGGILAVGSSESTDGDVSGGHGDDDYWVVKLTSAGLKDTSFGTNGQICLGGTLEDVSHSVIEVIEDGVVKYLVAGTTSSSNGDVSGFKGATDYWVVKLTSTGAKDTSFGVNGQKCLGGSSNEYGYSIVQSSDCKYIAVGRTDSNNGDVSGYHGGSDLWVVKFALPIKTRDIYATMTNKIMEIYADTVAVDADHVGITGEIPGFLCLKWPLYSDGNYYQQYVGSGTTGASEMIPNSSPNWFTDYMTAHNIGGGDAGKAKAWENRWLNHHARTCRNWADTNGDYGFMIDASMVNRSLKDKDSSAPYELFYTGYTGADSSNVPYTPYNSTIAYPGVPANTEMSYAPYNTTGFTYRFTYYVNQLIDKIVYTDYVK